ncbi:MAG: hypothetical protein H0X24_19910 [Ktedonobacterales bacterium]|nr:hypothetical protein [Ktedonobacterales bacterium]
MASNQQLRAQVRHGARALLQEVSQVAVAKFDRVSPVRRVALKINPAVFGEFLVMATLSDGQRYEARVQSATHAIVWCEVSQCNCIGFARTVSPLEASMTIED